MAPDLAVVEAADLLPAVVLEDPEADLAGAVSVFAAGVLLLFLVLPFSVVAAPVLLGAFRLPWEVPPALLP